MQKRVAGNMEETKDSQTSSDIRIGFLSIPRTTLLLFTPLVLVSYIVSMKSYLLFHASAELFSIIIASTIFIVAWNTREFYRNNFLMFLGIAYLFIGAIDLLHTLAYKGMGVFSVVGSNLATQFWIAGRYMEAISLLVGIYFIRHTLHVKRTVLIYSVVLLGLLSSIFYFNVFPTGYVEGVGLTAFKKTSEYVIILILAVTFYLYRRHRLYLKEASLRYVLMAIIFTMAAELSFTFYVSVYGFSNFIGHIFKIMSFYFIYRAVIMETLRDFVGELKDIDRVKTDIIANVSHELRTPLTIVRGSLEILNDEKDTKKRKNLTNTALKAIERQNRIIEDLLTTVEYYTKSYNLDLIDVDLTDVIQRAKKEMRYLADTKEVEIKTEIHEGLPTIKADPHALKQALSNLLENAIKFNKKKGEVIIKAIARGRFIEIIISDTGIGILQENFHKVFTPLTQLDPSPTRAHGGTGTGASVARGIIEAHKGKIWIESEVSKGSIFHFTIPVG